MGCTDSKEDIISAQAMQATGNTAGGGADDLMGIGQNQLKQKVNLNFQAFKLPDLDTGRSNTDPFLVLFEM